METSVVEQNRKLVNRLDDLCNNINLLTRGLSDNTIKQSIHFLQRYVIEFNEYDKLLDDAALCGEISFLDLFSQAFDSSMRQLSKEKKLFFQIKNEGEDIQMYNYDIVCEKYKIHQCFSCFGLLPQLLMDNAVKYAVSETSIIVDVHQDSYRKTITLKNLGPKLEEGEEQTIFSLDENYRGHNVRATDIPGQGIGLKIANLIIESHGWRDATISVTPSDDIDCVLIGGVPYSWFSIEVSIKEVGQSNPPPKGMIVREMLEDFLGHEYSRTNPLLGKHAREIYEESFSRKDCYHTIDVNSLRRYAYDLYRIVMDHLFECVSKNGDDAESDICLSNSSKRFDNQLITLIRRAVAFRNSEVIVYVEKGSFGLLPMYTSIHIFYYLLSEYIAGFNDGEVTILFVGGNRFCGPSIELLAPDGEDFNGISSSQWSVMCRIIQNHESVLSRKGGKLTITKNGNY